MQKISFETLKNLLFFRFIPQICSLTWFLYKIDKMFTFSNQYLIRYTCFILKRFIYTEGPTKDETLKTTVRIFLHSGFFVGQNWLILGLIIKYTIKILNWMQKPKFELQLVIFLEFWVVFTVWSFVGNPVYNRHFISI